MVVQFVADLERPLSRARLENYRGNNGSDLDMVVNYFYNLELSEALYPCLQAFEIALRNSVHHPFTQHFNNDYWFDTPDLFPSPPPPEFDPSAEVASLPEASWQEKAIQSARVTLTRENKPHDVDRIVAELHLGFWNSLFNRPFVDSIWLANHGTVLRLMFPSATRSQQVPRYLEKRITRIRLLRNRVMHFEPIWHRKHLKQNHEDVLETLLWISPAMHEAIAMYDRFQDVLSSGKASVEQRVQKALARRYTTN